MFITADTGWKKVQSHKNTEVLDLSQEVSDELYTTDTDRMDIELKYRFAQEFARQIVEQDLIQFQKAHDMYRMVTKFDARITIAPPGMSSVVVDDYFYEVKGMKFTHKEMEEAVLNNWPEKFL